MSIKYRQIDWAFDLDTLRTDIRLYAKQNNLTINEIDEILEYAFAHSALYSDDYQPRTRLLVAWCNLADIDIRKYWILDI